MRSQSKSKSKSAQMQMQTHHQHANAAAETNHPPAVVPVMGASATLTVDVDLRKPSSSTERSEKSTEKRSTSTDSRLMTLLQNEAKCEHFVQWMYREFSSESILCFIELVQFKHFVRKLLAEAEDVTPPSPKREYRLYSKMPRSSIVDHQSRWWPNPFGDNASTPRANSLNRQNSAGASSLNVANEMLQAARRHLQGVAHNLMAKYIALGSELEVNISAELRNQLCGLDRDNYVAFERSLMGFYTLFDRVIEEMFKFMRQSFVRFDIQENEVLSALMAATDTS